MDSKLVGRQKSYSMFDFYRESLSTVYTTDRAKTRWTPKGGKHLTDNIKRLLRDDKPDRR